MKDVALPGELPSAARDVLQIQKHVVQSVQARASDKNHESTIMVRAFRMCKPDEFGLVSRDKFRKGMRQQFHLLPAQADKLFDLVDTKGEKEIKYAHFRRAFDQVDDKVRLPAMPCHEPFPNIDEDDLNYIHMIHLQCWEG